MNLDFNDWPGALGNHFYGDATLPSHTNTGPSFTGNPGPYDNTVAGQLPPPAQLAACCWEEEALDYGVVMVF
jgi:hypothetical protein